jgi:hypothetical protein
VSNLINIDMVVYQSAQIALLINVAVCYQAIFSCQSLLYLLYFFYFIHLLHKTLIYWHKHTMQEEIAKAYYPIVLMKFLP